MGIILVGVRVRGHFESLSDEAGLSRTQKLFFMRELSSRVLAKKRRR
jgi:hypothetical protein